MGADKPLNYRAVAASPPLARRASSALRKCHEAWGAGRADTAGQAQPRGHVRMTLYPAAPPPAASPPAPPPAAAFNPDGWEGGQLLDPELIDRGYGQTMADGTIQTSFPPPEKVEPPPEWLADLFASLGNFFGTSGAVIRPILYIVIALFVLFLLYKLVPAFADWIDERLGRRRAAGEDDAAGQVEASAARALLSEAEALAAAGRYAEAVHLLLTRSVEDIAARRPGLVKPALTARDLAAADDLPGAVRGAFGRIAGAVERSLFGGRAVDQALWEQCRAAYAELTVARNWVAA